MAGMSKQIKKLDEWRESQPSIVGALAKIVPRPCQRAAPGGSDKTLLVLARLLARQAATEAMRLDRPTTSALVLGTAP